MTAAIALLIWVLIGMYLVRRNGRMENGSNPALCGLPIPVVIGLLGLLCIMMGLSYVVTLMGSLNQPTLRLPLALISLGVAAGILGVDKVVREANSRAATARLLADKDPLTGLWNRNVLIRRFQAEALRMKQNGGSMHLLMLDVDNFKSVNDLYGHAEGDRVLRDVARIIHETVGQRDIAVRYGGDEFAILVTGSTTGMVDETIARLEAGVSGLNPVGSIELGLSVGVSEYPVEGGQVSSLIALADQRMYTMKRNRKPNATEALPYPVPVIPPGMRKPEPKTDATPQDAEPILAVGDADDVGDGPVQGLLPPFETGPTWAFWAAAITAGFMVLVNSLKTLDMEPLTDDPVIWLLLLAGTAVGEALELSIYYRGTKRAWTFSDAFIVALMYVLPSPIVVPSVCLVVLVGDAYTRKSWYKVLFNLATYASSLALGYTVMDAVPALSAFSGLLPIICGALAYYACNNFMIYTMIGLVSGKSPLAMYRYDGQITFFVFACLSALGIGLGLMHRINDILGFLLLLPIFCVYYTYNKYLDLQAMTETTLSRLTEIIEKRDPYTYNHSQRVAELAVKIGEAMLLSERNLHTLELLGRLHDIGKVGMDDALLLKPAAFNIDERLRMQQHPELGFEILKDIKHFKGIAQSILSHHERWDGKGYPQKLAGTSIPVMSRILAVADTFDAMTSDRPYRRALDSDYAVSEIIRQSGLQFDPMVVEEFLKVVQDNPGIRESHAERTSPGMRVVKGGAV